jgi:alkaline phosphatase D
MLDESLDLVVFLGDYIYEYRTTKDGPARTHRLSTARTLENYRQHYALYKSDPDLQYMHAACPWLVTWDDHEVENNYAGGYSTEGTVDFIVRRIAGYQAFYEHMPLRSSVLAHGLAGLAQSDALRIYGRTDFGRLASFHLLDNRQYRDAPLCGKEPKAPVASICRKTDGRDRTMLGIEQERWLSEGFGRSAAHGTRWDIVAQQTAFSPRNFKRGAGVGFSRDTWDGFPGARQRLIDAIVTHKPRNPIFVGGDIHQNWVANVHLDPYRTDSPPVASEFCGTSIASRALVTPAQAENIAANNPHCLFADSRQRGYGVVELTPQSATVSLRALDDARRPNAKVVTLAKFVVEDTRPAIRQVPVTP